MDAAIYITLTRQSGLMKEMQVVAHNVANLSTTGFRREGVVFSEFIRRVEGGPSLSMAHAGVRHIDLTQAGLTATGGTFDFAIQGEGFFQVDTPQGRRLTRAGAFTPSPTGQLVTPDGHRLLDAGGTPILTPPEAHQITLSQDGTLAADGEPIARIGLFLPVEATDLRHEGGTLFDAGEAFRPTEGAVILQGHLEDSNVNPVAEIARMIEVQRAYEMGQSFLDQEDQRMRRAVEILAR